MSVQENIRTLDSQGIAGREIARRLGVSRDAVAKYTGQQNYSPRPPSPVPRPAGSALTGFEDIIETWLGEDQRRPRKQRHTAKRVFDRLVNEENYTGSYSPVQRFVKKWNNQHRQAGEGFTELVWPAGTAQVDFGQAEAFIAGVRQLLHIFVVTFPFSNMRFVQAYRGETAECVCHGLRTVFDHIGAAPRHLVFDNATGIGRRVGTKVVESKLFGAFKLHYRSESRFCNPYAGNEKGNVENAVGFLRRNLMVPEPEAATLEGLNDILLGRCLALGEAVHYRKGLPVSELFAQDVAASLALPGVGFDPVRYENRTADKKGNLLIEGNTYAAGSSFHSRTLTVGLRHDVVEILDEHSAPVRSFPRAFGVQAETIFEPAALLPLLVTKPGAWSHSQLRPLVPEPVRDWLDKATATNRRRLLSAVDAASGSAGFDAAITAADLLIQRGDIPEIAALGMLARRLAGGTSPAVENVDLSVYDIFTTDAFTTVNTLTGEIA
ncbi:IS21 family transposase [Cryobacterium melibiosiphilum]|uniref:IS21 family transposase n=1 Tax=Cryobacterium melibiosiphilum TaxID=995039 RepID=A0A3A5MSV8_9MICO|nr:IS21 family transposase [Cryobacterium melibiosiphilum]RJT90253.1 IS21 family transposase [Cryobacterium melibiosiphilum]